MDIKMFVNSKDPNAELCVKIGTVPFYPGAYLYINNYSQEQWNNNLLARGAMAQLLNYIENRKYKLPIMYCYCIQKRHHISSVISGQSLVFEATFSGEPVLSMKEAKPYITWYKRLSNEVSINIEGEEIILKKYTSPSVRAYYFADVTKPCTATLYGFDIVCKDNTINTFKKIIDKYVQLFLSRYNDLIYHYIAPAMEHMQEYASFYVKSDLKRQHVTWFVDSTGIYLTGFVKRDDYIPYHSLPNECQLQQNGYPSLTLIQQFAMISAMRKKIEEISKNHPSFLKDGTKVYYTLSFYYGNVLLTDIDENSKPYIGWAVECVYEQLLPIQLKQW